jgi:uncharacterized protein
VSAASSAAGRLAEYCRGVGARPTAAPAAAARPATLQRAASRRELARYDFDMPRKLFKKYTPSVDRVREVKALAMFGDTLFHPALWHLNRRSAAGGVAVGMFCGLIPGPLQMLGAAIVCLIIRVNLPVALLTTLYTNPFTIVPLYLLAYQIGSLALGASGGRHAPRPPDWDWSALGASMRALLDWTLSLGTPLALGLFMLACLLAAIGYFTVRVSWNVYLRRAWAQRRHRGTRRTTQS